MGEGYEELGDGIVPDCLRMVVSVCEIRKRAKHKHTAIPYYTDIAESEGRQDKEDDATLHVRLVDLDDNG